MSADTHVVSFEGGLLTRGFWLYVWEVTTLDEEKLVYVGRTGDSSSANAQSPFVRMGQHLGFAKNSNMLRTHLGRYGVDPGQCRFRLVAHGPILPEVVGTEAHRKNRDVVAAMEKQLAEDLCAAGYTVMNNVASFKPLDRDGYAKVRAAFAEELLGLWR
jgi:hypothetical protein